MFPSSPWRRIPAKGCGLVSPALPPPAQGEALFDLLVKQARAAWSQVATGEFGADMQVALINDGPVTFLLES
ncbi:hypothetical protein HSBAA_64490 [Vreelandella sulfidaeris]|uniref:D-tyrosyl-tRNA(Tyr) deacylase n=1 Tax=Vreelandella sulfidaeris TaxID=115553 RepID=A0A455UIA9_9GAMM|nr:hypothetical protein HSBAA_64490 [Halomonas sulfidaeris]